MSQSVPPTNLDSFSTFSGIRALLPSVGWAGLGSVVLALAGLLVNMALARAISPSELGLYFLALSMASGLSIIAQMGLSQASSFKVSQLLGLNDLNAVSKMIVKTLAVAIISSTVVITLSGLGGIVWMSTVVFNAAELTQLSWIIAIWVGLLAIQGYVGEVFRGLHEIQLASIYSGSVTSLLFLLAIILYFIADFQLTLRSILYTVVGVLGLGVFAGVLHLLQRVKILALAARPTDAAAAADGTVISYALLQLFANMANYVILAGDIWILAAFKTPHDVALYSVAVRLMALVTLPLIVVNLAIPGIVGRLHSMQSHDELNSVLRMISTLVFVLSIAGMVVLMFFPAMIINFLFGAAYEEAQTAVRILVVGYTIHVVTGSSGVVLMMTGNQRYLLLSTSAGALVMISLGLMLVEDFSITGIATAASLGLVTQKSLTWWFAKNKAGVSTHINLAKLPQYTKQLIAAFSRSNQS